MFIGKSTSIRSSRETTPVSGLTCLRKRATVALEVTVRYPPLVMISLLPSAISIGVAVRRGLFSFLLPQVWHSWYVWLFLVPALPELAWRFPWLFRPLHLLDPTMSLLARVVRNEAGPIAAAMFVLATLLMVAASFAFIAEHEAQPEAFASIPDAMWWTIVTMTTVGYGDMVPVTPLGKVLGGVIAVIGLGMVALPAGLLAAGFSEQLHLRKRAFEDEVHSMLKDGVISADESDQLEAVQDRLGLTDQQAAEIMHLIKQRQGSVRCPHCGHTFAPGQPPHR